jgi:hypothetical protein
MTASRFLKRLVSSGKMTFPRVFWSLGEIFVLLQMTFPCVGESSSIPQLRLLFLLFLFGESSFTYYIARAACLSFSGLRI